MNHPIPVLYDETHHGKWYTQPRVESVGNLPNLMGYLEHHAPNTDGSFGICIAGGNVNLVSKKLYESIPEQHRPPLDTRHSQDVNFAFGGIQKAIGSIIMPVVLTEATTGRNFCIKIYALTVEELSVGMFIGQGGNEFLGSTMWSTGKVTYNMQFGNGHRVQVEHQL